MNQNIISIIAVKKLFHPFTVKDIFFLNLQNIFFLDFKFFFQTLTILTRSQSYEINNVLNLIYLCFLNPSALNAFIIIIYCDQKWLNSSPWNFVHILSFSWENLLYRIDSRFFENSLTFDRLSLGKEIAWKAGKVDTFCIWWWDFKWKDSSF